MSGAGEPAAIRWLRERGGDGAITRVRTPQGAAYTTVLAGGDLAPFWWRTFKQLIAAGQLEEYWHAQSRRVRIPGQPSGGAAAGGASPSSPSGASAAARAAARSTAVYPHARPGRVSRSVRLSGGLDVSVMGFVLLHCWWLRLVRGRVAPAVPLAVASGRGGGQPDPIRACATPRSRGVAS